MSKRAEQANAKIPTLLAGVAGEYFVAAELSRRGHIASISLRNTRGIDILATNAAVSQSVTIQCKTNQLSKSSWILNDKCESFASSNHFYVFVVLGGRGVRPRYHIVPSSVVARRTGEGHRRWLGRPGLNGRVHQDSKVRKFEDNANEFLERWDLLGL